MSGSLGLIIKELLIPSANVNLSMRVSEEVQFLGNLVEASRDFAACFNHDIHFLQPTLVPSPLVDKSRQTVRKRIPRFLQYDRHSG